MGLWKDRAAAPHLHFSLCFHKQPQWAHVLITGRGDVPAVFEALSCVDTVPIQEQAGVRIVVAGVGKFDLADLFLHRDSSSCVLDCAVQIINREHEPVLLRNLKNFFTPDQK